jgi:hypothetical protein
VPKTKKSAKRPDTLHDPNLRGEWVEMQFAADAASQGFTVLRPLGHWTRFDWVLEYGGGFVRVQVKSTGKRWWSGYGVDCRRLRATSRRCPYRPDEIDFIVAYVSDARAWYIIPIQDVLAVKSFLRLDPYNEARVRLLEQFRGGWRLLRRTALRRRPHIRARASTVR